MSLIWTSHGPLRRVEYESEAAFEAAIDGVQRKTLVVKLGADACCTGGGSRDGGAGGDGDGGY